MNSSVRSSWSRSLRIAASHRLKVAVPRCESRYSYSRASTTDAKPANPVETLRYPDPPTTEHRNLPTYVSYAERTGLDTGSTTYVGTHYEYTVAAALQKFGFDVRRVGGRGDYGTDLLGTWSVPSSTNPLRVLLQCKVSAPSTKIGPHQIRELEGAFVGAPPGWRGAGVIGFLVTQKAATKGIRDSLGRSRWPMGFISCSSDGKIQQMLWNAETEAGGLAGMGVGIRLSEVIRSEQELVLTWRGKPIHFKESQA
ncbi:hypothetical protein BJ170DRAFT_242658 [Xylariales sp. AK1849]|nr:hypothetical protein BJ170DRAFT_242658 [Xylariales sp. AK1849]